MINITRDDWLTKMPELIYKLKKDYGFYYSGLRVRISKDILDVINTKKHKHKIVLYQKEQKFFLVVYRKNDTVIYFTKEYMDDKKWHRIKYFEKKFLNAYKKAESDLENELLRN